MSNQIIIPLILTLLLATGASFFYYKITRKPASSKNSFKDASSIKVNAPLIMASNQSGRIEFQGYANDQGVMVFDFNRKSPLEITASYRFVQGEEVFAGKFFREDILNFMRAWEPTLIEAPDGSKNDAGEVHIGIKFDVEDVRDRMGEHLQEGSPNTAVTLKPIKELSILDGANALFTSSFRGHTVAAVIPYKTLQAMVSEWYTQVPASKEQEILDEEFAALLEQEMK